MTQLPLHPGTTIECACRAILPNRHVIHCLGPIHGHDKPADALPAQCYRNALLLAEREALTSIGFPARSTGAFGYPMEPAAHVAFSTIAELLPQLVSVHRIRFVLFTAADAELHQRVLESTPLRATLS